MAKKADLIMTVELDSKSLIATIEKLEEMQKRIQLIEKQNEELKIYKDAFDSMASQMICPKMTGLEMAKSQLGIAD